MASSGTWRVELPGLNRVFVGAGTSGGQLRGQGIRTEDGRGKLSASISLEGRTAVVTGAGAGLGRSRALALAAPGARVVVNHVHSAAEADVRHRSAEH